MPLLLLLDWWHYVGLVDFVSMGFYVRVLGFHWMLVNDFSSFKRLESLFGVWRLFALRASWFFYPLAHCCTRFRFSLLLQHRGGGYWQLICTVGLIIIGSISPAYHHAYIEGELLYTIGRLIFIIVPVRMCRIWIALER